MELTEIKSRLSMQTVLDYYGLKPDRNHRLNCPFHEDKTPSLQVYAQTDSCYCFSSNCKTHGKSMDVIDFIMYREDCSKHRAIEKAVEMIGKESGHSEIFPGRQEETPVQESFLSNPAVLERAFGYFRRSVESSPRARAYLEKRGLDFRKTEAGYNSGSFYHRDRENEQLMKAYKETGLLRESDTGENYSVFGRFGICFPLKDRQGHITGLYFRSTVNDERGKHYYLKNRRGLYPGYPRIGSRKLILTEAVIDAATLTENLQQVEEGAGYEVLACYGTNGLTEEHLEGIGEWFSSSGEDKEILFGFDNDGPGNEAVGKYAERLQELFPGVRLSKIEVPPGEDLNSVGVGHGKEVFGYLLKNRFFFSTEHSSNEGEKQEIGKQEEKGEKEIEAKEEYGKLDTGNPWKIAYRSSAANYYVQGGIGKLMDSMRVTLVIEERKSGRKSRSKVDLYEDRQVEKVSRESSGRLNLAEEKVEADLYRLTDLLEEYREKEMDRAGREENAFEGGKICPLTERERKEVEDFLKSPELVGRIGKLLGESGIAGEENNRIFLWIIAVSYKMGEPLHGLIQGSSGSGKTRLLRQISDCMPPERVVRLTRVSERGFYNYPENYLKNKLISLEDVDGLGEEASFAFRELQSNGELNSATSLKLESGRIVSGQKKVKGPIASLACTTQGEIYEDNMSRVFLIAVDESREQTERIIRYQNLKAAGKIDTGREGTVKRLIRNIVRELKPREVVNPYADRIRLPEGAYKIRRLNELFGSFIRMITVINQYQRKQDNRGRLISQWEDISEGIEILFESIVLKVDELDGSLRQFYEKLKRYVEKRGREYRFTRFEVREATGLGKTQQHHYISRLLELEYLQQYGYANRGYKYRIVYWDDYRKMRTEVKEDLQKQLEGLAFTEERTPERTPERGIKEVKVVENQAK
jgi:DNA primase